jgi:hypothetical protein
MVYVQGWAEAFLVVGTDEYRQLIVGIGAE